MNNFSEKLINYLAKLINNKITDEEIYNDRKFILNYYSADLKTISLFNYEVNLIFKGIENNCKSIFFINTIKNLELEKYTNNNSFLIDYLILLINNLANNDDFIHIFNILESINDIDFIKDELNDYINNDSFIKKLNDLNLNKRILLKFINIYNFDYVYNNIDKYNNLLNILINSEYIIDSKPRILLLKENISDNEFINAIENLDINKIDINFIKNLEIKHIINNEECSEIISNLNNPDLSNIKSKKTIKVLLKNGFKLINENYKLLNDELKKAYFNDSLKYDINNLFEIKDYDKFLYIIDYLMEIDYDLKPEEAYILLNNNKKSLSKSMYILEKVLKYDVNYAVECMEENNHYLSFRLKIYEMAINLGYEKNENYNPIYNMAYNISKKLKLDNIENLPDEFKNNDDIMSYALECDYNNIIYYQGDNINLYYKAIELGFKELDTSFIINAYKGIKYDDFIMENAIKYDLYNLYYYLGNNPELMFKTALKNGYKINDKNISKLPLKYQDVFEVFEYKFIKNKDLILNYDGDNILFNYIKAILNKVKITDNNFEIEYNKIKNKVLKTYDKYKNILFNYKYDKVKFLLNEELFNNFLDYLNIDKNDFIQYEFGNSYDYLSDIIKINNNSINDFKKFYNFMINNYSNNNKIDNLKLFEISLKNYNKYNELINNIINIDLNKEDFELIINLFKTNYNYDNLLIPKNIDDLKNMNNNIFSSKYYEYLSCNTISSKKDIIANLLFNNSVYKLKNYLKIYGNTYDLKNLAFINKDNKNIINLINEMLIFTTSFESIININNVDKLDELMDNIINNKELVFKCSLIFSKYEDNIKKLYAEEINTNLTKINEIKNDYLDKLLIPNNYGIPYYDFSNQNYILLAHVMSDNENIEQIVNGYSDGFSNYISLSSISYVNQIYYNNYGGIIFGYDNMNKDNYIMSSIHNISSNNIVSKNSNEVGINNDVITRGIRESSDGISNSEILCFREGLKPTSIIIPDERIPSNEEIEIAKKYNLCFIKTQKINKRMTKPALKIEKKKKEIIEMENLKNEILNVSKMFNNKDDKRRFIVFGDVHGIYEAALAILEDARIKGISEIYSLGDNIGHGANSSEVMDLLKEYNVTSIKGNHELYLLDGIDAYKKHIPNYNESKDDMENVKNSLRIDQIDDIKNEKDYIELTIGGKNILLCHSVNDYNTGQLIYDLNKYDEVIQGHIHFSNINGKIRTLRGAGIGSMGEGADKAYYIEIIEKENGYDVIEHYVKFDQKGAIVSEFDNGNVLTSVNRINNWLGIDDFIRKGR